jgi:hypothetical protein
LEEEDVANHSGRCLCAGLVTVLVLSIGGSPVAGQEQRDRAPVIGPHGDGDSWRAPDARVVKPVLIRPPVQTPTSPDVKGHDGARKVRQSPAPAGDFWTPEELRRLQPPPAGFEAPAKPR